MQLPNLRVQNQGASLKVLFVNNTDLTRDKQSTYLNEDVVATGTTIRVQSIIGFESLTTSSGQIVCIGEIGNEGSEIIKTSSTTALSTTYKQVTLASGVVFNHSQDTKVYIIDWDRIEFDYSATATGTKTTLKAYPVNIQADVKETIFRETEKETAFYFARFNASTDSRSSDWSDAISSSGWDDNTVGSIKRRALAELNEEIDGDVITDEFLNAELWKARREYHSSPGKRPFRRKYNTIIGTALTGSYRVELPADVETPYSADNIYGVRIGTQSNMAYYDKKEWDFDYSNKPHTTTEYPYVAGTSTSIWLTNGRDFSHGSSQINIEGQIISCTPYEGSLSGDSLYNSLRITSHPSGAYNTSAGSDAWSNISLGLPDKFTVWANPGGSAYIYFNRPLETAYVNQNIYCDYYRTLLGYNSDGDKLDEEDYDMFVDYLKAVIKHRKNRGGDNLTQDSDFQMWLLKKNEALNSEQASTEIRISPSVGHLPLPDDGYYTN